MNREEAIDEIERTKESYYSTSTPDLEFCLTEDECSELIDKIFDAHEAELNELKNRTCEGCKLLNDSEDCENGTMGNWEHNEDGIFDLTDRKTFSCNKWEKKDELIDNG